MSKNTHTKLCHRQHWRENAVGDNMYECSEPDYLIYNVLPEYANLILSSVPEKYLKAATEYKPLKN